MFLAAGAKREAPPRKYHALRQSEERVAPKAGLTLASSVPVTREDVTLDFLRDTKCEHAVPRCDESFAPAVSYDVTEKDYSNGLFLGWDPRHSVEVCDEKMTPLDETYSGGFHASLFVESAD